MRERERERASVFRYIYLKFIIMIIKSGKYFLLDSIFIEDYIRFVYFLWFLLLNRYFYKIHLCLYLSVLNVFAIIVRVVNWYSSQAKRDHSQSVNRETIHGIVPQIHLISRWKSPAATAGSSGLYSIAINHIDMNPDGTAVTITTRIDFADNVIWDVRA